MARMRRHDDRQPRRLLAVIAAVALLLLELAGTVRAAATASTASPASPSSHQSSAPTSSANNASSALLAASPTSSAATPTVYNASAAAAATGILRNYAYRGCYLEINGLNGTAPGARSLEDGTDEVLPGDMTVLKCLTFCGGGSSGTAYTYAGLEYARECWCGQDLSALATQEAEAACNLPCDGDNSTLCGGDLRLTLYVLKSSAGRPAVALGALLLAFGMAVMQLS